MEVIFVSGFIAGLIEKLASDDLLISFGRQQGIFTKLKRWQQMLNEIQPLLTDAEERQTRDENVKVWLEHLLHLAYDLDNLVDNFATEASRRNLMAAAARNRRRRRTTDQATTGMVMNFISTCFANFTRRTVFVLDRKMKSQMDVISTRLDDIFRQKDGFGLRPNVRENILQFSRSTERMDEAVLVDLSRVFGRQNDIEAIVHMLLKDYHEEANPEVFSVIPIVGMGGLGKTTLAHLVYNDATVKGFFDLRAWVSVPEDFDVFGTTKLIFERVTGYSSETKGLNDLQVSLKENLSNQRFLLVLDDVWSGNYDMWDLLRVPLLAGAPGSKIIVTTRMAEVASMMAPRNSTIYHLEILQIDECLSLLAQHALGTRNFDAHPNLNEIGKAISIKCHGWPMAVKLLGGLLRTELSLNYWKEILNKISDITRDRYDLLPALMLSYINLPSHLKPLFVYCSIFPYGYEFDRDELVLLWMAEGFLQQSQREKPMEELGCEYFNELIARSIFQSSFLGGSRFVMHDLIHDLAKAMAVKISFRLDSEIHTFQNRFFEKARYSSFIRQKYEVLEKFKAFHRVQGLRTFLPLPIFISDWQEFYLSNGVLTDLLLGLQCVRVLSLSGYSISEIPDSIGDLKHLRYLNLSDTLIKWLPESVSDLYNLQTLLLCRCRRLTKLPTGIGKLINLRHLDCTDTNQLREMPPGIGKLTSLRTLSKIVLCKDNGLRELSSLSDIRGRLTIEGLHTVTNIQDAREANLSNKHGIDEVTMEWRYSFYDSRNHEKEVLEVLQPPRNLKKLNIILYGGTEFPKWVGDTSFSSMVDLELRDCRQCTSLPSLGQLPFLKKLHIHGIDRLKSVGIEFYGDGCPVSVAFPSLETLSFKEMPDWEEWSTLSAVDVFPRLRELIIRDCPSLIKVSLSRLPSLRVLKLNGCSEVVLRCIVGFASLTALTIQGISGLALLQKEAIQSLGALENLEIKQCREMTSLWEEGDAWKNPINLRKYMEEHCFRVLLQSLESLAGESGALLQRLKFLSLDDCPNLENLPNGLNRLTSLQGIHIDNCPRIMCFPDTGLPPMLRSLKIRNCKALEVMHSRVVKSGSDGEENINEDSENFSHLQRLWIEDCSSLTSFPIENLPSTLKELCVLRCMKLEPDAEKTLQNCMSTLDSLTINGWMNFRTFPVHVFGFRHLTELIIQRCPGLESFPKNVFPSKLRKLAIRYCVNLKLLPDQMQTFTYLAYLDLYGCPNLNSFPQGGFPPNLKELTLGNLGVRISEWNLQGFASLNFFGIQGECEEVVNFPGECQLPTCLRRLKINGPVNLESFQNIPSLEDLSIWDCPKLRSLPKTTFQSLSCLDIWRCPLLEEKCLKERGKYWPLIAQIPCVMIDCENIHKS